MDTFVSKLRQCRVTLGITQQQAAQVLGVDRSYVSIIEKRGYPQRLDHLAKLAALYRLTDPEIAALVRCSISPKGDPAAAEQRATREAA